MIPTRMNGRSVRKTCPSAVLFTKNPTYNVVGWNPILRGERPANDRQSRHALFNVDGSVHLQIYQLM
jgi:hypothetical protein